MILRGKLQAAPFMLIIVMRGFSVHTLTCHPSEYMIRDECCPMCPAGSRVKIDCTEIRSTSCLPCVDGSYMDQPTGLKQCFPCSICDSGSGLQVKQSCRATSDTVCEAAEGFFCMDSTSSSCSAAQKHSSCKPGQYISKQGTSSSDSECSDCRDGTFSDGSSSSCRPHTQCESENLHQIKAGTSSSDAECGEKPSSLTGVIVSLVVPVILLIGTAGVLYRFREKIKSLMFRKKKNPENVREEEPNEGVGELVILNGDRDGRKDPDPEDFPAHAAAVGLVGTITVPGFCCRTKEYTSRDEQCCPMCNEGSIVRRDCTALSGTQCSPCETGTFMNHPNGLTRCFPCTSCDAGQGLFAEQACTTKSDAVCDVLSGYFCKGLADNTGCSWAEKHSLCAPGQRIKEPGTDRSDTVCEECQVGYFSPHGVNCTLWTECSEAQIKMKEGTSSSDVVCGSASRNHYTLILPLSLWTVTVAGILGKCGFS